MAMKPPFFRHPWPFWLGLALRVALIALAVPLIAQNWFVPFIHGFIASPSIDPWRAHLVAGGDPLAFPYGPVMFLALLPTVALGAAAKALFGLTLAPVAGYGVGLLLAEMACLGLLTRLQNNDTTLAALWLSPAVIIISYWHGQNDLVPVAFMLASIVALRRYHTFWSGALLGLAIAAKLSMVLAAPILAIYLYRNARLRSLLAPFLIGLAAMALPQLLIFAFSTSARAMVLGTPEARKVFQLALDLGGGLKIFILPVVYLIVLFWAWRLRRMTFDLLLAVLGIVFLLVILLTPASPGWFIWVAPFLAIHAAQTGPRGLVLVFGLSILQAISTLVQFSGAAVPIAGLALTAPLMSTFGISDPHPISVLVSTIFALGLFIAYRLWREGVRRNEFYRLSWRPLVIGIAGDSGSGKDTLAIGMAGIFGEKSVASISGDDYHRWDRARPMWGAMTHLNPRANDLERMTNDLLGLASGGMVTARHYDHTSGRFTKPRRIDYNDVIIVSGLHALLVPALRERCDVRVFLDMDEELRRFFKIGRDTRERGHALEAVMSAIERRVPDAERFVRPQREHADIVFSLLPVNREHVRDPARGGDIRLKLKALLLRSPSYEALVRTLIGICGLHVDVNQMENSSSVELIIEGEIEAEDVAHAAAIMIPNLEELVALAPEWRPGVTGLMQLILLTQVAHALRSGEVLR